MEEKTNKWGFNIFALVASIFKLEIGSKWYFYLNRNFLKTVFSNGGHDISTNSIPIDLKFSAYVPLDIIYGLTGAFFLNAFFICFLLHETKLELCLCTISDHLKHFRPFQVTFCDFLDLN